jgi:hypothetical protein
MYGYGKWSITEQGNVMLNMWERKSLGKVYGSVTEQEI